MEEVIGGEERLSGGTMVTAGLLVVALELVTAISSSCPSLSPDDAVADGEVGAF